MGFIFPFPTCRLPFATMILVFVCLERQFKRPISYTVADPDLQITGGGGGGGHSDPKISIASYNRGKGKGELCRPRPLSTTSKPLVLRPPKLHIIMNLWA